MINTDLQVLHAIQAGPSGADVKALARIVESLMAKADKLDNAVETLIEQQGPDLDSGEDGPCERGCIDEWASAECPTHGVKAFLAGVFADGSRDRAAQP